MSSATDDCPYYIPTRPEPRPPPTAPPPNPLPPPPAASLPAIHIHLAPHAESSPVSPRPWYFTGSGLLWLLFAFAIVAGGAYVAIQYLNAAGWL